MLTYVKLQLTTGCAMMGDLVGNRARPRLKRSSSWNKSSGIAEIQQGRLHDKLAQFEDYSTILTAIRKDVARGMSTKELQQKYAPLAQARVISEMLTNEDGSKAIAAAKDLLDRVEGRATEKKEVTHRFKDMSDKELDAILASEEEDLKEMEERFEQ